MPCRSPSRAALASLATLVAAFAVAVAGCASSAPPAWTYAPAPSPTPIVVPSGQPSAPASPGASASAPVPSGGVGQIQLSAEGIEFDKATIQAPAGQPFQIFFQNNDAGQQHNVEIKDANQASVYRGEIFPGVDSRVYDIPPLGSGNYSFVCTVHPNMVGTLVAG
jgi:plastocyanin